MHHGGYVTAQRVGISNERSDCVRGGELASARKLN